MISFNKPIIAILTGLFLLYLILSYLKIHTSSIAAWDYFLGKDYKKSVLWGEPQLIRQDEWMINTPNAVNLYENHPLSTKEALMQILRPRDWPYFFLKDNDHERKFAFSWNMKVFGFLVTTFLLLLLFTSNNLLLSLTGSLIIMLSSAFQWWSYHLGMHMIGFNILTLGLLYFIYTSKKQGIFISAWLILVGLYGLTTDGLYPAWQVPLGYMYLALFAGYIWQHPYKIREDQNFKLKAGIILAGLIVITLIGYDFYQGIIDQASALMNTEYPGKRFATGGDVSLSSLFNEYPLWLFSSDNIPSSWSNICESSTVLFVFPVVLYCLAVDFFQNKKPSVSIYPLLFLNGIFLFWILIGFFPFLSKITLMSFTPGPRTLPVLGISNILVLIIYLAQKQKTNKPKLSEIAAFLTFLMVYFIIAFSAINKGSNQHFNEIDLGLSLLFVALIFSSVYFYSIPKVPFLFSIFVLAFLSKNLAVHPVTKGLKPLIKNHITQSALEIKRADPEARWAVFGSSRLSALLIPAGVNKINGVQPIPVLSDLKVLDPQKVYEKIYNRYAHISIFYHPSIRNRVVFQLPENPATLDSYSIIIDPCNEKLKTLNVKYLLFTYKPSSEETRCLTLLHDFGKEFIYGIN